MTRTTETVPPERQSRPTESSQDIVDHIFELPFESQLGILRTIAPKILGCLRGEEREGYLRDLNEEIRLAERGEPSYDVRREIPTH